MKLRLHDVNDDGRGFAQLKRKRMSRSEAIRECAFMTVGKTNVP